MTLLNEKEIGMLAALQVGVTGRLPGQSYGSFRGNNAGAGPEFRQYRQYCPGDDLRTIDWHHYVSKRQLLHKVAEPEVQIKFSLVIDLSDSIVAAGEAKVLRIRQLAAALGYLLLKAGVNVTITNLQGRSSRSFSGLTSYGLLADFIESVSVGGTNSPADLHTSKPGHTVLISDMLCHQGVRYLVECMNFWPDNITLINLSLTQERQPDLAGDFTLADPESGREVSLNINPARIKEYQRARELYFDTLARYAAGRNWLYYDLNASAELSEMLGCLISDNGILL
ncbi:MAG: DUF58 domain-containing protein [Sedimentisphaerales bacterium]|nr:DUF58 domain-containing protein [Sedimentisphaerales bacterium]MBN2844295.1 DUF58 domain-containing protein [Sedimentisphaerales bacterium]